MDAPMGSAVIQTAGQYRYYQERREDVTKRYYDRIKLFRQNRNELAKKPQQAKSALYCSICKENYKIAKKHIDGLKHSTAVVRDKEVYKSIDSVFNCLAAPKEGCEKVLLEPTIGTISTVETDVELPKRGAEEGKLKTEVPRKKREPEESKCTVVNKRNFNDLITETAAIDLGDQKQINKRTKNIPEDIEKTILIEKIAQDEKKPKARCVRKKKESVSNSTLEKYGIFLSKECCNK